MIELNPGHEEFPKMLVKALGQGWETFTGLRSIHSSLPGPWTAAYVPLPVHPQIFYVRKEFLKGKPPGPL